MRWALAGGSAGFVSVVAGGHGGVLKGVDDGLEIRLFGEGAVAVDFDETEFLLRFVGFDGVFVDEAAGVDGSHLARVKGGDFFEVAGGFGATVFGQAGRVISVGRAWKVFMNLQDWHGKVLEIVDFSRPR